MKMKKLPSEANSGRVTDSGKAPSRSETAPQFTARVKGATLGEPERSGDSQPAGCPKGGEASNSVKAIVIGPTSRGLVDARSNNDTGGLNR